MPVPDVVIRHSVLCFTLLIHIAGGQVSYSIPEEMAKGSTVGNIDAQDLGLDLQRLKSGKARIFTRDSTEYIELNRKQLGCCYRRENGPRVSLVQKHTVCFASSNDFWTTRWNYTLLHIEIMDINDNAPVS